MSALDEVEDAYDTARRLLARSIDDGYAIDALHRYDDAHGEPVFYRVRLSRPGRAKVIRPMRRDGSQYVLGEPPASTSGKPLYRLPELIAAGPSEPVFVVEGEKCVDALAALGLVATTTGSASSANGADWTPLAGRSIVLWSDNDDPGLRYVAAAAKHLHGLGCDVRMLALDVVRALPDGGDCVDWLREHPGSTAGDVRRLPTLPTPKPPSAAEQKPSNTTKRDGLELVDAMSLEPEPIRWLWRGWLARGKLHVLAGAPGTGKTTIAMDIAACISSGRPLPCGQHAPHGRVLIWSGEDDPNDTLIPRLIAAGADLSRIQFVGEVSENGERFSFDPARDIDLLATAIGDRKDIALLVVDPLVSAVAGDSHKNAEVRRGLAPLADLALRIDAALLGITHYSKGSQGRDPLERVSGSLAFGAVARIVLGTVRQQAEDGKPRMMLARAKSNIGQDGGGFDYALTPMELPEHNGLTTSRIAWGIAVEGTARELLAEPEQGSGGEQGEARAAVDWLREELSSGPVEVKDLKRHASDAGFAWRTVQRAMRAAGVASKRAGFGMPATWSLQSVAPEEGQSRRTRQPFCVGANEKSGATEAGDSRTRSVEHAPNSFAPGAQTHRK